MRALVVLLVGLVWPFAAGSARAADGRPVLASIKPVHALVAGVMQGTGRPQLLLKGGVSPHTYALRPSDARAIAEAAVIFWIGPDFEVFLENALRTLAPHARIAALGRASGVTQRLAREADEDAQAHEPESEAHGHGRYDPHVWLDSLNAAAMVRTIAAVLSEVDPANAQRYEANAGRLEASLRALDGELEQILEPVADGVYVVFHDAYGHLEARYGLAPAAVITVNPEIPPGAARVAEVRRLLKERPGICVFAEPQFEPRLIRTLTAGTGAQIAVLDPLGNDLKAGPALYFELMQRLGRDLRACLEKQDELGLGK